MHHYRSNRTGMFTATVIGTPRSFAAGATAGI
jgi:hypothetical protein